MNNQKQAPEVQEAQQGQNQSIEPSMLYRHNENKVTKKLSPLQQKVYDLLLTGQFRTVEISLRLHIADPRRVIKCLRDAGIAVSDVWDKSERYNAQFKRYFIRRGGNNE